MKAAVLTGIREMEIVDLPKPEIRGENDVLLKIEMVGVCGSDVHYYETGRIGSQVVEYPYRVGHECAATVEAVGSGVGRLKAGDRVAVDPAVCCHECDQCLSGRENTCRKLKFLGCPGQLEGCLCEYIVMPEECCFLMSDAMSFERGVLTEPLAIGYYAVKQSGVGAGGDVAILGAGPIGLSCLASAKQKEIGSCFITDKIDERVTIAKGAGAEWAGNPLKEDIVGSILAERPLGMDAVFECAGEQETIDQAVEMLKCGGKLMLIGIPREKRVSFEIDKVRRKEITVINVRRQNDCTGECVELLGKGEIDADFMVTHYFGLERAQEAFDLVAGYRNGVVKAMITMGNGDK